MKKLLLLASLLVLVGCDDTVTNATITYNSTGISEMTYTKDNRTGLCFAVYNLGNDYGTLTNVPCTDEVEREITVEYKRTHSGTK